MDLKKVGIIGDTHYGVRNGDKDFLDFSIRWMQRTLADMHGKGIKTVIQLGDFFDNRKFLDIRAAIQVKKSLIDCLKKYDMHMFILVGNHSIYYRDDNSLTNLFIFDDCPNITVVNEYMKVGNMGWMGWMNKNNTEAMLSNISVNCPRFGFGHLELADFAYMKGVISVHGMDDKLFGGFERVYSGHFHTVSRQNNIVYAGSPYHLTWGDYPDGTNRGWFELDTDTGIETFHANKESDSLFMVFNYDKEITYSPSILECMNGKMVRIVIADKGDTKKYNKFLSLLTEVKYIEMKLIDESMVIKKEAVVLDMEKVFVSVVDSLIKYTVDLAATMPNTDPALIANLTAETYKKAVE